MTINEAPASPATEPKKVSLDAVFSAISNPLKVILTESSTVIEHPGTKGDASEFQWVKWLKTYLPKRYSADKGFVIDSSGSISEQQDIIIYDRQYTPTLLDQEGVLYVPAESVYAIIEVKQELNKEYLIYAGEKIKSVRTLKRTSASYVDGDARCKKKEPKRILGGLVCLKTKWKDGINTDALLSAMEQVKNPDNQIDLACCLGFGSFVAKYEPSINLIKSTPEAALVFFFLNLLQMLGDIGTVCAIDYGEYAKSLKNYNTQEVKEETDKGTTI
jgi:hypothetical protein